MEARRADEPLSYDVVVVGGAVSGASTAIVLKRGNPKLRILVVEKTDRFDWKVGESTVEVSAYFLTRVLKQWTYLSREQLPKQAFRYWFFNDDVTCLREASETGPTQLARTPSFQLDRAKLDEHLLEVAGEEGSEVWRPAKVTAYDARRRLGPEHADRREERRHDGHGLLQVARGRDRPPGDARAQARRRHADRVTPHGRDLGSLQERQGHGRRRSGRHRPRRLLAARRPRSAPPRDEPLHGLGLLDLVHPAARRRDERRPRLGQAARDSRGHDAARQADPVPRHQPPHAPDDRGSHGHRGRLPVLRAPSVLRRQVHRPGLGPGRATPEGSSIPSTRPVSTRCPSRSGPGRA